MRCLLVLVIIVFSSCIGYTQDKQKIDSYKTAYQNATHDTTRVILLLELSDQLYLYWLSGIMQEINLTAKIAIRRKVRNEFLAFFA